MPFVSPAAVKDHVGKEIGVSDWVLIDQSMIDKFADVTGDHQFIHVDPEAAAKTPFGGTIAHGFLTLSLLSQLAAGVALRLEGLKMGVNYGFEKVRFANPVKTGRRVRGRFTLISADERLPGQWSFKLGVKIEIEGEDKPALVAEWLTMQII
ncbi:MAG TPA: MaoC family dehydratase [Parvularculaceae bacterium]|nr:MaoC family dehydratase [Parvularculaceae bacterium]